LPFIIGVDESGKGDFFGPLVIAAFLASDDSLADLARLGVRDSKTISDRKLLDIDEHLRQNYPHAVVVLLPDEYNRQYQKIKNLNILLAQGHSEVIIQVADRHHADKAISDKFGKPELIERELHKRGSEINLEQIVRGEAIPQVAAASILARARFINEMELLSQQCGMTLPKGAGHQVDEAGKQLVRKSGVEALNHVAKTHFKNYQRVINPGLFS
jgi:ribonuclease HIII